jgi:hypothetical protein
MNGAIGHVDLDKVWPYTFPQLLREKKGYATGAQQLILEPLVVSTQTWGESCVETCATSALRVCCCGAAVCGTQRCLGSA